MYPDHRICAISGRPTAAAAARTQLESGLLCEGAAKVMQKTSCSQLSPGNTIFFYPHEVKVEG